MECDALMKTYNGVTHQRVDRNPTVCLALTNYQCLLSMECSWKLETKHHLAIFVPLLFYKCCEPWSFCSEKHSHENNSSNQYVPLRSESACAILKDFHVASLPSPHAFGIM